VLFHRPGGSVAPDTHNQTPGEHTGEAVKIAAYWNGVDCINRAAHFAQLAALSSTHAHAVLSDPETNSQLADIEE
jgi:hypothetical protein